jgi:hypothetical protein
VNICKICGRNRFHYLVAKYKNKLFAWHFIAIGQALNRYLRNGRMHVSANHYNACIPWRLLASVILQTVFTASDIFWPEFWKFTIEIHEVICAICYIPLWKAIHYIIVCCKCEVVTQYIPCLLVICLSAYSALYKSEKMVFELSLEILSVYVLMKWSNICVFSLYVCLCMCNI